MRGGRRHRRRVGVVPVVGERGRGAHRRVHEIGHQRGRRADKAHADRGLLDLLVALDRRDAPQHHGAHHEGVAQVEHHERPAPCRDGGHQVGVRGGAHHGDGGHEGDCAQPHGQLLAAAQHHEPHHDEDGEHHAPDQLLGDAGRDVPEPVEDALPVLQVQEGPDAADHERHGRCDKRRHLQVAPLALKGQHGHAAQKAAGHAHEEREDNERPLRFHYSSPPSQCCPRRM